MKLKLLAAAAVVALSSPAFADTQTFSDIAAGSTTSFSGGFDGAFETDTFTFNLLTPGIAAASVFNLSFGGLNQISDFAVTFAGVPLTLVTTTAGTFFNAPINLSSFTGVGQASRTFTLTVSGRGTGSYSGAFAVSAVPEPGSIGLMLAGLGVLGFVANRRRNKV